MTNPFQLINKTILVTGASSGIGRGIAIACAEMGAQVVLTARNRARLNETLSQMDGDGHVIIPADLTNIEERTSLVEQLPTLDGVVHCAGIGYRVPCKGVEQCDVEMVLKPNTEAPILLQGELLRGKKIASGSAVVFIASCAATMPTMGNALYSASKAAIVAYAKVLAQELAPRKIRVNCISPTMVMTDLALVGATQEQLDEAEKLYPLKRYGKPEDIAYLAVYLLSNASEWVTGSNMEITGGALTL